MAKILTLPILILYGLFSISVQAKIYKYVDDKGQVHYSSEKPTDKRYKPVQVKTASASKQHRKTKNIKILPTKELDKAVKEGRISKTIAARMRYVNSAEEEYKALKKKKRKMRRALSAAKSKRSTMSPAQVKRMENEYKAFVKEDYYYGRLNYTVARDKLNQLLNNQHHKKQRSSHKSKTGQNKKNASIKWN